MRTNATVAVVIAMFALAGCGAEAPSTTAAPPPAPTTAAVVVPPTSAPPEASAAPTHVKRIKIPDVVGKNHQLAQDTMQAAGLYDLREEDATGQGRLLVWDRNWEVVRQTPPAGKRVTAETVITLFSKKIGE